MLDGELDDDGLALVGEGLGELGGTRVELGVLARLDSGVPLLVAVVFAGRQLEGPVVVLVLRLDPALLPRVVVELLLEEHLRGDDGHHGQKNRCRPHDQRPNQPRDTLKMATIRRRDLEQKREESDNRDHVLAGALGVYMFWTCIRI